MPRFKEQAVCIRLIDWSETSQIVALLTEGRGKVRGLAKGSKRLSPSAIARYSGGIELLTRGQAVGLIKPSADLANITEWDLQEPYHYLRRDLTAQRLALYAADLVNAMLAEVDPHPTVFAEFIGLLEALVPSDEVARAGALLRFQWRLLTDCGYSPQLDQDVHSGAPIEARRAYLFDPHAGGLTHTGRAAKGNTVGPWRVRRQTIDLLRGLATDGEMLDVDADVEVIGRANRLLCVYARALLDRQLPTMTIVLGNAGGG